MKAKNKLEGAANDMAWKTRMDLVLARHKGLGIVTGKVTEPSNQARKKKFQENDILARNIIIKSIRDHLIPYIVDQQTSKGMYDAIIGLYNINNINQSISLKGQLRNIKMTKNDTVASYFVRISQIRDQLKAIKEQASKKELVVVALGGLPRL